MPKKHTIGTLTVPGSKPMDLDIHILSTIRVRDISPSQAHMYDLVLASTDNTWLQRDMSLPKHHLDLSQRSVSSSPTWGWCTHHLNINTTQLNIEPGVCVTSISMPIPLYDPKLVINSLRSPYVSISQKHNSINNTEYNHVSQFSSNSCNIQGNQ